MDCDLLKQNRLGRERKTIRVMIGMYCRGHHRSTEKLCAECEGLLAHAMQRIDQCPYRYDKPTCARCPIHCYRPEMRERIRQVMRFAGPRMLLRHPLMTILHYRDEVMKSGRSKAGMKGKG